MITVAPLAYGFKLEDQNIAVITESDLYQYVARSRKHYRKKHAAVSDGRCATLPKSTSADPVVHEEHGIGRYMGLVTMDLGDETNEMMLLEYAGEAQLMCLFRNCI